jgi:hypothetical protein
MRTEFLESMQQLSELGYSLAGTPGTAEFYSKHGIPIRSLDKPTDESVDKLPTDGVIAIVAKDQVGSITTVDDVGTLATEDGIAIFVTQKNVVASSTIEHSFAMVPRL